MASQSRQWRWMSYLFSLCSLWPVGQNYANQCQNPDAVIHWYKYFDFHNFFYVISLETIMKYDLILIPDLSPHFHCYCRTPVTATPSTPSTRTSRSAPRCSTSAGGGAADGRLCGSARTVTPLKVDDDTWWHEDYRQQQGRENADPLLHFCSPKRSFNCQNH